MAPAAPIFLQHLRHTWIWAQPAARLHEYGGLVAVGDPRLGAVGAQRRALRSPPKEEDDTDIPPRA
eukprot:8161822-Alexandrium_andersonii.AAC.1